MSPQYAPKNRVVGWRSGATCDPVPSTKADGSFGRRNGKHIEGYYKDDRKDGTWKYYAPDGSLRLKNTTRTVSWSIPLVAASRDARSIIGNAAGIYDPLSRQ